MNTESISLTLNLKRWTIAMIRRLPEATQYDDQRLIEYINKVSAGLMAANIAVTWVSTSELGVVEGASSEHAWAVYDNVCDDVIAAMFPSMVW